MKGSRQDGNGHQPGAPQVTRRAVALKYDAAERGVPIVAAKGTGRLAEEMMAKAKEHGVPVQEDKSLVEVLSRLDLDQEIPPELYHLVAEILTFIYRSDQTASEAGR